MTYLGDPADHSC